MRSSNLLLLGGLLLGGFVLVCLLLFLGQRRLMYFPDRMTEEAALRRAASIGMEPWRGADGRLRGWRTLHPGGDAQACLLVFHGNAGSALDRDYLARAFQGKGKGEGMAQAVEVRMLEYPGYGCRPGEPGEATFLAAASEALDALKAEGLPVVILGESIGSGVASVLAGKRPRDVAGLILVTPYTSFRAVARHHYPFFPSFLVRDPFEAARALRGFQGPVAFLVAGRDEVVPAPLGLTLHAGYGGPKRLWIEDRATHNTLDFDPARPLWEEILRFAGGYKNEAPGDAGGSGKKADPT